MCGAFKRRRKQRNERELKSYPRHRQRMIHLKQKNKKRARKHDKNRTAIHTDMRAAHFPQKKLLRTGCFTDHMKESKSPLSWRRTRCEVNWARMIYVYTQDTFSTKIKTVFYDPQEDNMNRKKSRTHPKRRDKKKGK